jgi:hypothetical protein
MMNSTERQRAYRERIAKNGGATVTFVLSKEAADKLKKLTYSMSKTKRELINSIILEYKK